MSEQLEARTAPKAPRWRKPLAIGAALAVALYATAAAGPFALERRFLYHPVPAGVGPDPSGPPIEVVQVRTADGETLVGWWLPPKAGKPVILFFHGNASTLEGDIGRWRRIADQGAGFLAIAYRGYGGSTGRPSEKGLHQDALAAYDWLAARHPPSDIVIHGFSLGSAVAVKLASERPARALILDTPFTSVTDVAARTTRIPVTLLIRDRFLSRERIGEVKAPVLIIHGDRDTVIPFTMGEALYEKAKGPKTFVRMVGSDHNTLTRDGEYDHIWRFLGLPLESSTAAPGWQAKAVVKSEP